MYYRMRGHLFTMLCGNVVELLIQAVIGCKNVLYCSAVLQIGMVGWIRSGGLQVRSYISVKKDCELHGKIPCHLICVTVLCFDEFRGILAVLLKCLCKP